MFNLYCNIALAHDGQWSVLELSGFWGFITPSEFSQNSNAQSGDNSSNLPVSSRKNIPNHGFHHNLC